MSMTSMVADMRNRFVVAAVFAVAVLAWSPIGRDVVGLDAPVPFGLRVDVWELLLSLPVVFYSSWIFFDGAWRALRTRTLDMMVLVVAMPKGKPIIHATLDPADINKDVRVEHALVGDAGLTLDALIVEVKIASRASRADEPRPWPPRSSASRPSGWRSGCQAHIERQAAVAVPRDLGPSAHGGRGAGRSSTHDRGQPAGPDLALLGVH